MSEIDSQEGLYRGSLLELQRHLTEHPQPNDMHYTLQPMKHSIEIQLSQLSV